MACLFTTFPRKRGFTLIELLIVVTIMGILAAAVAIIGSEMIRRAKVARAQGDLNRIGKAIRQLEIDTNLDPGITSLSPCINNGLLFTPDASDGSDASAVGLVADGSALYNSWKGPYIEEIPKDPWNRSYYMQGRYICTQDTKGCEDLPDNTPVRAIYSSGANRSAAGTADSDNVVLVLCH